MQPDRRAEWSCFNRTGGFEYTDMQPDSIGQRGQNGVGFLEQEIQKRIQICSKIGGQQRGQNGAGFIEKEIQKRIQICSNIGDREDRLVMGLWNKRYRKGYRYATR
jgi:hypothetical protein